MSIFNWTEKFCMDFVHIFYQQILYATILFIAILGLTYFLKEKSPYWHHGLWILILIRLVLPPDISFSLSARNLINQLSETDMTAEKNPKVSRQSKYLDKIFENLQGFENLEGLFKYPDRAFENLQSFENPEGLYWKLPYLAETVRSNESFLTDSKEFILWPVILTLVWITGFVFSLLIFIRKLADFYCITKHASPVRERVITETVTYWRKKFGIWRFVRVVSSDEYLSPFTIGILRPVIFIPMALTGSKETINSVIAHEMVHIKRFDDLWIKFQNFVQIICFFHPVVWYANRQISLARERICDAVVLSHQEISPQTYGQGILNVLKLNTVGIAEPMAGFGNHRKETEHRIRNIMKEDIMKKSNLFFIFVITALIGIFLLPMAPHETDAAQAEKTGVRLSVRLTVGLSEGWFASKFDPGIHTKEKLPENLRADKRNPNLKSPGTQIHTFQVSVDKGCTPGLDYYTNGLPIRAPAAGIVHFVGEGRAIADNAGGLYVRVYHDFYDGLKQESYPRVTLYRNQAYRSTYYHLSRVEVRQWQRVRRGQVIGFGFPSGSEKTESAKLVLEERGNMVNPDDYGLNHGFMNYWDEKANYETDLDEMNTRLDKQKEIVEKFNLFYSKKEQDNIYKKIHTVTDTEKYADYPVRWSRVDMFRYLARVYAENPGLFPGLSAAEFETMKKEFYNNQPIILTLPFRKSS